jgi:hypothetical protein
MNAEKLVGSLAVRVATAVFISLAALGLLLSQGGLAAGQRWAVLAAIVCAVLAALGGIHCSRRGYALWMRTAAGLSEVMATLVFGLCYLVLVPFFVPIVWLLDPLQLRRGNDSASYWHERSTTPPDAQGFRRMG